MPKFPLRLLCAFCLAAVLVPPARADDLPTFELRILDGRFEPATLVVPANTKFRLRIRNESRGPEEYESDSPRKEKVLAPGASSFLIYQPLAPGRYPFFGDFYPDTMRGEIIAK
ncbi:MAG: cupredoxin domain-containing protein [Burkholderiales bacterium]